MQTPMFETTRFHLGMLQIILTIINNIKTLMHRAATVRTMCRSA